MKDFIKQELGLAHWHFSISTLNQKGGGQLKNRPVQYVIDDEPSTTKAGKGKGALKCQLKLC